MPPILISGRVATSESAELRAMRSCIFMRGLNATYGGDGHQFSLAVVIQDAPYAEYGRLTTVPSCEDDALRSADILSPPWGVSHVALRGLRAASWTRYLEWCPRRSGCD